MASITFWGGVGTVTGSRYLVESHGVRVLVDCGLFQGLKELRERNWEPLPFDARKLDAVLITHAHIDHTGYLPRLAALGYSGPIFCSKATAELLKILLPDSARLQEEEADYRNRHGLTHHQPAKPLYTEQDAKRVLGLLRPIHGVDETILPAHGFEATFFNSGHVLGSRFILVNIHGAGKDGGARRILFSGDLGNINRPILKDPFAPPACDYLLIESTYGDRLHDDEDPKTALARVINQAAARNAPILIPAFAIGRTQDLLYFIRELEDEKKIPVLPVHVDSPMASEATKIYARQFEEHDPAYAAVRDTKRFPLRTGSMMIASSREESKQINDFGSCRIIISASGMMTGGRVLHHAQRILPNPDATIVFVGYQAAGTTGRKILNGDDTVTIFKQPIPVRCHIERIEGFSGHPDWKGVLSWLEKLPSAPRETLVTHGEPESAEAMKRRLEERFGWKVVVPQYGDHLTLE